MIKRVVCFAMLAVAAVSSSLAVSAIDFQGMGLHDNSTFIQGNGIYPDGSYNYAVKAGQMNFLYDYNTSDSGSSLDQLFLGYCITPNRALLDPQTLTNTSPFVYNLASADPFGNAALGSAWDGISRLVQHGWSLQDDSVNAAVAFQFALWSLASDAGTFAASEYNLASNVAGSVGLYYQNYLAIAGNTSLSGQMAVFVPTTFPGSGQIIVSNIGDGTGSFEPVPEPFTMMLGIAAAGTYVRRRAKAKKLS